MDQDGKCKLHYIQIMVLTRGRHETWYSSVPKIFFWLEPGTLRYPLLSGWYPVPISSVPGAVRLPLRTGPTLLKVYDTDSVLLSFALFLG